VNQQYRKTSENLKHASLFVINDKPQGSVTTRLRCGGLFSNHFTTYSLLSLLVKHFLICEPLAKLQARRTVSHALCAWPSA